MELKQQLQTMFEEYVKDTIYELIDLTFQQEGGGKILRIYIDSPTGIMIEDCTIVSRAFGKILDNVDPIKEEYSLEVSSPGLNRRLVKIAHFERFAGNQVKIKINEPLPEDEKRLNYKGILLGVVDDSFVKLELFSKETVLIPHNIIIQANVVYQF